jgi:hypothetical protein
MHFAASIFWRGLIAMIVLFYLYYLFMKSSYRGMKRAVQERHPHAWMVTAASISLLTLLPPWAFTHYLVSKASGHMYLFFLFAIVIACLDYIRTPVQENSSRVQPRAEAPTRILRSRKPQPLLTRQ